MQLIHTARPRPRPRLKTTAGVALGAIAASLAALFLGPTAEAAPPTSGEGEAFGRIRTTPAPDAAPRTARDDTRAEQHTLGVTVIGLDGTPATGWTGRALDAGTAEAFPLSGGPQRVPEGDYVVTVEVGFDDDSSPHPLFVQLGTVPDLDEDTELTFDLRESQEIDLTVFDPSATQTDLSVSIEIGGSFQTTYYTSRPEEAPFLIQQVGPAMSGDALRTELAGSWRAEDGTEYHASYQDDGRFVAEAAQHAERSEMARVDVAQGAATGGTSGALRFQSGMGHISTGTARELPATTTAYVNGGLWRFFERIDALLLDSRHQTYQPGESYERTINVGVFGPGIGPGQGLYRTSGDTLMANLGLHTDGAGNIGAQESWVSGSTTLYRDGEELASVPEPLAYWTRFELPEEPGTYRLSTTGAYDGPLSSEISASFTFASSPVTGEEPTRLPASVVRFTPRLDLDSTAPAGARTTVPLALSGSAGWEDLASLTVEVSYDRGGSWQQVPVEDHAVTVTNPAAGGSVSFRAELADRDGNTTSQTILDAYRTR